MCGGTGLKVNASASSSGLSPRVRGNHAGYYVVGIDIRSIPACAGEPT